MDLGRITARAQKRFVAEILEEEEEEEKASMRKLQWNKRKVNMKKETPQMEARDDNISYVCVCVMSKVIFFRLA